MVTGHEYVVLSFFKKNGIDYIYNPTVKEVEFPCFQCHEKVSMCTMSTLFLCGNCKLEGNIITLIKSENYPIEVKVYNPKREIYAIKNSFDRLLNKDLPNKDLCSLEKLKSKVETLLDYYDKNTS